MMLHKGCLDPILHPQGSTWLVVLMIQALAVVRFVRMVYALTLEMSHVTHSTLSLSADPPSHIM